MRLMRVATAALLGLLVNGAAAAETPTRLFAGLDPAKPDRAQSLATDHSDWHKDAIVYHLWVAAFRDSDGAVRAILGPSSAPGVIHLVRQNCGCETAI